MEHQVKEPEKVPLAIVSASEFVKGIETKPVIVAVPEFGPGKGVRIQPITLESRQKIRSACQKPDGSMDEEQFQVFSILFGVAEPKLTHEQVVAIRNGDPRVADRIANAVWTMSKMKTEARELKNA